MIIRCPSCTTRFDLPASRFGGDGTMIKCAVCGHGWIEGRAVEISRESSSKLHEMIDSGFEPDLEIRRLVNATRDAQEAFTLKRKHRRAMAIAWLGLAVVSFSPAVYALSFPAAVVKTAPASIALYDWMGRSVNIYGLDIRKVEMQHLLVEGQRIISIKGEIVNISREPRKIPWLRFGLKDATKSEVFHWQLDTNSRPLNPGEATSFVTRISSPPETAGEAEIRFARAHEIGSTASP